MPLHLLALVVVAQQPTHPTPDSLPKPVPAESSVVTPHTVTIDGQVIRYSARAGTLLVRNDSAAAIGSFFYVTYTREAPTSGSGPSPSSSTAARAPRRSGSTWVPLPR